MESPGALPSRGLVFQLVCRFHRYWAESSKSSLGFGWAGGCGRRSPGRTLPWAAWMSSPICSVRRNNATQRPRTCSWSLGLSLLCVWRQPQHARAPPGDPAASPSLVGEPESGASWPVQWLQRESPSTSAPPGPPCSPLGTGPLWGPTGHQLTSATRPVSLACRQNLSMGEPTPQTHVPSGSLFT